MKQENGKKVYLDIGIKGESTKEVTSGICSFSGLKFLTTSYYHEVILNIRLG